MSHFTQIKTQIKDIQALEAACKELGLPLLPHTEARGYNENKIKGDYVIQLKGPYDIAVNKQGDGTFGLTADMWQGHGRKGSGQELRQTPPALRRPQNPDRSEEERVVSFTETAIKRLDQTRADGGVGSGYERETKG